MSNFDKDKIVLPPPPTKAKLKLKRVHTIAGSSSTCHDDAQKQQQPINDSSNTKAFSTTSLSNDKNQSSSIFNNNNNYFLLETNYEQYLEDEDSYSLDLWTITQEQRRYYIKQFSLLQKNSPNGTIQGNIAKIFFEKSGLEIKDLAHIWKLSDVDEDGALSLPEFCIAMHLVVLRRNKVEMPNLLPLPLRREYKSLSTKTIEQQRQITIPPLNDADVDSNNISLMESIQNSTAMDKTKTDENSSRIRHHNQNWTRFNDSPFSLSNTNNSNNKLPISSSTSPAKLANFDYNFEYIVTNPNIRHPVPLRVSPSSPTISQMDQLFEDNHKSLNNSFTSSNSIDSTQFSPLNNNNNVSPNDVFTRNFPLFTDANGLNSSSLTMKNIIDYLRIVENRFSQPLKSHKNNIRMTIVPENISKIDELYQTIRTLDENNKLLNCRNQEMSMEIRNLVKIIHHLINQTATER